MTLPAEITHREKGKQREKKPLPVPLHSPQIPQGTSVF
jgi:hypothetical protein